MFGLITEKKLELIAFADDKFKRLFGSNTFFINITFKDQDLIAKFIKNGDSLISKFYLDRITESHDFEEDYWSIIVHSSDSKNITLTENDVKEIFESLFFELEIMYTDGYFKLKKFPSKYARHGRRVKIKNIPNNFNYNFSKNNNDLVDFFKIANEVNFAPFKFLSYYHILEYFAEKSLLDEIKNDLKETYNQPDFDQNANEYLLKNIKMVKKKIRRQGKEHLTKVITLYGNQDQLREDLINENLKDFFTKITILDSENSNHFPIIDFEPNRFIKSLSKRINSIRNSIVHSNIESLNDDNFLFKSTEKNIRLLSKDIRLMRLLSINVIKNNQINGLQQSAERT